MRHAQGAQRVKIVPFDQQIAEWRLADGQLCIEFQCHKIRVQHGLVFNAVAFPDQPELPRPPPLAFPRFQQPDQFFLG
ncbi:MAG: hypothetical protein BWY71_01146 [Planctomycetes bacterium ADurb.Bin412]|nr:MAG: hypothetical protein BWY71_01146 [Planctomycetes bacterium ADurb.Bin412]